MAARQQIGSTLAAFRDMSGFLFGATAMFATMYETQAILPTIGRDFGESPSQTGLTVSLVIMAVAIGGWVWGPLSDRIGRRRSLVLSSTLLTVPTLAGAFAPDFGTFLACRIVQGLCMPGLLIVGVPFVIETYAPRHGGRVTGIYLSSLVAGGLVGRVGVAVIASATSWRWAVALLTALPVLAAVVMARTLPAEPERPSRGPGATHRRLVALLRNGRLLSATFAAGGTFFAFTGVYTYAAYRLEGEPFGLSPAGTGFVFFLWMFGVLAPVMGLLVERRGWRQVSAGAQLLSVAGVVLTLLGSLPAMIVGLGFVVIGSFSGQTAATLGQGTSTATDRGLASAIFFTVYYTSGALAAYLPGLAWESWGWKGVASSAFGGYAVGLSSVVAGALWLRRRRAAAAAGAGEG